MENDWQEDGLATQNAEDLLRKICHIADSSIEDVKILDDRSIKSKTAIAGGGKKKRKATSNRSEASSSSDDESSSEEED